MRFWAFVLSNIVAVFGFIRTESGGGLRRRKTSIFSDLPQRRTARRLTKVFNYVKIFTNIKILRIKPFYGDFIVYAKVLSRANRVRSAFRDQGDAERQTRKAGKARLRTRTVLSRAYGRKGRDGSDYG